MTAIIVEEMEWSKYYLRNIVRASNDKTRKTVVEIRIMRTGGDKKLQNFNNASEGYNLNTERH
jgi:hypothetical protein